MNGWREVAQGMHITEQEAEQIMETGVLVRARVDQPEVE